jgi:hypothetical protein
MGGCYDLQVVGGGLMAIIESLTVVARLTAWSNLAMTN